MKERNSEDPPDSRNFLKKETTSLIEPKRQVGSFFVAKEILIKPEIKEIGITLKVNQDLFSINFPKKIWAKYPPFSKKILSENLAFALSLHLPYLREENVLNYQMPEPNTKEIICRGFQLSLPATALMKSEKTSKLLKKFAEIKYQFNGKRRVNFDSPLKKPKKRAVLLFSFGKDSLLTYSLCEEIGIETIPFYVKEPYSPLEDYNKEKLARRFFREFRKKIFFIENGAGRLRDFTNNNGYGWELNLAQFGLMGLPIAYAKNARYLFYSNEQSCNDRFLDKEGFWGYPAYDQTVDWMSNLQKIIEILGLKGLKVGSLLEPIHDLAIIRILHHRYPRIAKYQMSCSEDDPQMRNHRWCGNCSKCARVYILLLANNINPKNLDFPNDMLKMEYKHKFALFNGNEKDTGYDKAKLGRDEQLLAFLLAYRNGYKGELIDLFRNLYLKEAKKREKELREKYFGLHSTNTIPKELKEEVLKIYREELKGLGGI